MGRKFAKAYWPKRQELFEKPLQRFEKALHLFKKALEA